MYLASKTEVSGIVSLPSPFAAVSHLSEVKSENSNKGHFNIFVSEYHFDGFGKPACQRYNEYFLKHGVVNILVSITHVPYSRSCTGGNHHHANSECA